ncbi:hypothetical protein CEUSTIGMA_g12844.t1 [Chlamydomonas eustigma]|uniref:Uncharacterized protein n=1 Tax=Chlamydomonas eustigma TaxID=1157962 RepID=A0A250XQU0_9CHLO|nr:hypothetical protein CEUSTIGMA_g12844.t1 [Chlamydomonas eustigma]|eukprot:GAX85428.1 hypothetical protein CEUSTIGMA_g12844.t1 [Chlamydomonas eustigma]
MREWNTIHLVLSKGFMEEAVQKLGPALEVAAQARDIEEIQACADRLRIMTLSLHDLIGSVNSPSSSSQPSETTAWLQASAYELYSAYCTCLELLYSWSLEDATSSSLNPKLTPVNKDLTEDKDSCGMSLTFTSTTAEFNAALTQLHSVVSNSSPVSDLHLLLSVKRWSLQQQWLEAKFPFFEKKNDMMSQTSEMDEMKRGVCEILQARYGPVSPDVLIRLINASSRALDLVQI